MLRSAEHNAKISDSLKGRKFSDQHRASLSASKRKLFPGGEYKLCNGCQKEKTVEEFHKSKRSGDGLQTYCKRCVSEADRKHRYSRRTLLRTRYGISLEQYDEMLKRQNGRCLLCARKPKKKALHVDHCHKSNKVRALLCDNCNRGLGHLQDDPELLRKAADYIEEYAS